MVLVSEAVGHERWVWVREKKKIMFVLNKMINVPKEERGTVSDKRLRDYENLV